MNKRGPAHIKPLGLCKFRILLGMKCVTTEGVDQKCGKSYTFKVSPIAWLKNCRGTKKVEYRLI